MSHASHRSGVWPKGAAFVAGAFMPVEEAAVPILDRGFVRSDATYDVAHVWRGRFFRLDDHLERFEASMRGLALELPYSRAQIAAIMTECVRLAGLRDAYVQVTCTRGVPPAGSRDPRTCRNRFYAFAVPFVWIADETQRRDGMRLHVAGIERIPPESVDPRIKNFHWIDLTQGLLEAYRHDADIGVLVDRRGNLTEGTGFNIFVARDGALATPERGVFEGMTRRTVIELCHDEGIPCEKKPVPAAALADADEVFLTSTAGGIMPIREIDGRAVGDGQPGPLTRRLDTLYWSRKAEGWLGTPVDYGDAPAPLAQQLPPPVL